MSNNNIVPKIDPWDLLTTQEQNVWIEKARYLTERNYIILNNEDIEDIARDIYLTVNKEEIENGPASDSRLC